MQFPTITRPDPGIGAALAGLSIMTRPELLLVVLGLLFVIEVGSVALQVSYFKATKGKRIFKMSPIHHHFELKGWAETTVVVRFWIIAGVFVISYATQKLGMPRATILNGVMASSFIALFSIPFFGWLSDKIGRRIPNLELPWHTIHTLITDAALPAPPPAGNRLVSVVSMPSSLIESVALPVATRTMRARR